MAKRSLAYCSTCGAIRWRNGQGRDGLFVIAADYRDYEVRVPPAGDVLATVAYESAATGWTSVRIRLLRPLVASDAEIVKFDK